MLTALACLTGIGAASDLAAQWPMFRAGPTHAGAVATRGLDAVGAIRWELRTDGPVRSSAIVHGGSVFVGSGDGSLYAVDFVTGTARWRHPVGAPISSTPATDGERVYFQDDAGLIHAVGFDDGASRWTVRTGPPIPFDWGLEGWDYLTSSPVLADGFLVVGAADGRILALDPRDGRLRWSHPTEGRVRATPAVAAGTVYVGSADGHLYALDLESGRLRWRFRTRGVELDAADYGFDRRTIQSSATITAEAVYFGSRDANLYRLDHSGREVWASAEGSSWVVSTPAVAEGVVYAGLSSARRFDARDAATGALRFSVDLGGLVLASPVVVGGTAYITSETGRVHAIDLPTGEARWSYRLRGPSYSSPTVHDGVLLVGDDAGYLHALEAANGHAPRRAVFWDEALRASATIGRVDAHRAIVDHFASEDYEVLDAGALIAFLRARVADRLPSVVVFAMDAIPEEVAAAPRPRGLFHDYLAAGGKVVWLGMPPFLFSSDPEGPPTVDREAPGALLGVDHGTFNTDRHMHRATPEGIRWGLDGWWMGWRGVDPADVSLVLASDDEGLAAAWVRTYGGPPGTGFVRLQPALDREGLERIQAVAEHGVFRK